MEKKSVTAARVTVFVIVVLMLGFASIDKLIRFYVNDEIDYNEWKAELGSKFETDIASSFFEKFAFVNLNGGMARLLGQPQVNGVTKLNNGWLHTGYGYVPDEQIQEDADKVIKLNNYLRSRGTEFLYLIPPYTSDKYDPQLPAGVEDYGNDDLDRLVRMLVDGGVEVIDIRETMHDEGIDHYEMMYRTDHHWTPRAGFYAFGKINDWLINKLGCEVDTRTSDLSNYNIVNYEKWHLGSRGQSTGAYYAGIDDFELITPKFETSLSCGNEMGTFESLIIDMEPLETKDQMSRYTYDHVYGNAQKDYVNNWSKNDVKLMVYSDSFSNVVTPFLSITYAKMVFRTFGVSWADIENNDPDAVVMFYFAGNTLKTLGNDPFYIDVPEAAENVSPDIR